MSDDDLIEFVIDSTGVVLTAEERDCVRDSEYIDVDGIRSFENEAGNKLLLAVFKCAPAALAQVSLAGAVVEGVDDAGVLCGATEAIKAIATLPDDEALAALEAADYPEVTRAAAIEAGREVCGLTEDQVALIIDG